MPYKLIKPNESSDSSGDEYIDAALLAKDPALAEIIKNKPKRVRPARTKTHGEIQFEKKRFDDIEAGKV